MRDTRPPLDRALDAVASLEPGTWPAVEAPALLAIEARDRPEGVQLLAQARSTAAGLQAGSWDSITALALLHRADREVAGL